MSEKQFVLIGNSAASLAALEAIRRSDQAASITLVADEPMPAYSRVLLPYFVSGERADLTIRPTGYYQRMNAKTLLGRRAVRIEKNTVLLDDGSALAFDRLLIATGSRAAVPAVEGIDTPGVFALKSIADAERIRDSLSGARNAVILGGGLICLLVVRALHRLGLNVTLLISSNRVLSRMLDAESALRVQRQLTEAGVRIETRTDAARILAKDGRVRAVATTTGLELPADLIILAKGIRANTDLAGTGGLAVSRGVEVNGQLQTSRPDVYSAGDCTEAPDLLLPGKRTIGGTWFEAVWQGEAAGAAMAGAPQPSYGVLKMNVMETLGAAVASIGLTEIPDQDGRTIVRAHNESYRKLLVWRDRIVGAVLVGDVSEAGPIASLIRRGITLSEFARFDPSQPIRYPDLALPWRPLPKRNLEVQPAV